MAISYRHLVLDSDSNANDFRLEVFQHITAGEGFSPRVYSDSGKPGTEQKIGVRRTLVTKTGDRPRFC